MDDINFQYMTDSMSESYTLPTAAETSRPFIMKIDPGKQHLPIMVYGAESGNIALNVNEELQCEPKHKWFGLFGALVWKCTKKRIR